MRPMTRRFTMLAAAAVTVGSLGLAAAEVHGATAPPSPAASTAASFAALRQGLPGAAARPGPDFAACEQQLERAQPRDLPRLAVLGASFTAGVGSSPGHSWAVVLARHL